MGRRARVDDRTTGLSADMIIINPVGFLTLTLWNWGVYFSPLARDQYKRRHGGHSPQISTSDLAFSLHALIISTITLLQVIYYAWRNDRKAKSTLDETDRLLTEQDHSGDARGATHTTRPTSTIRPSLPMQIALIAIFVSSFVAGIFVWSGKTEWLDWLYFVSTLKLFISLVKYVPQVVLNYRLKSSEGLAINVILLVSHLLLQPEKAEMARI